MHLAGHGSGSALTLGAQRMLRRHRRSGSGDLSRSAPERHPEELVDPGVAQLLEPSCHGVLVAVQCRIGRGSSVVMAGSRPPRHPHRSTPRRTRPRTVPPGPGRGTGTAQRAHRDPSRPAAKRPDGSITTGRGRRAGRKAIGQERTSPGTTTGSAPRPARRTSPACRQATAANPPPAHARFSAARLICRKSRASRPQARASEPALMVHSPPAQRCLPAAISRRRRHLRSAR